MKRKSIITLLLSVLLIAVVLVGGTLAYLVAEGKMVVNSFALADVNTEIEEPVDNKDASAKTPYVVNYGASEVYVRARAVVVTRDGSPVPVTENDMTIHYNTKDYSGPQDGNTWVDTDAYWEPNDDGWYYYTDSLTQNQRTEPLFDGVEDITADEGARFDIYVYHESVLASAEVNGPAAFGE